MSLFRFWGHMHEGKLISYNTQKSLSWVCGTIDKRVVATFNLKLTHTYIHMSNEVPIKIEWFNKNLATICMIHRNVTSFSQCDV